MSGVHQTLEQNIQMAALLQEQLASEYEEVENDNF